MRTHPFTKRFGSANMASGWSRCGKETGNVLNTVEVTGEPFFHGANVPGKAVTDTATADTARDRRPQ